MSQNHPIILCVDDDPDDQTMIQDTIQELDPSVKVVSVVNGIEAMTFLYGAKERQELPCLVIMDINMPVMTGKQAILLIKKDKTLSSVPVVLFTTSSARMDKMFADFHGLEFIPKPDKHQDLQDTIRRLLDTYKCN